MAYYASAMSSSGTRKVLAVGPFRRHGDALRLVDALRRWGNAHTREGKYGTVAYGTARDRTRHAPGRFNDQLGVEIADDGFVVAA